MKVLHRRITFANMMGPVIGNIGNLQFVLVSVLGGFLSIMGIGGITLGVMASYLQLQRALHSRLCRWRSSLTPLLWHLPEQSVLFALIDEESEKDEGYVTLVNAQKRRERQYYRMQRKNRNVGLEASTFGRRKCVLYRTDRRCAF